MHSTPIPLVLSFHGWRSNAQEQLDDDRFDVLGDEKTFLSVWPEGYSDVEESVKEPGDDQWGSFNGVGSSMSPGPQVVCCDRSGREICES